MNIGILGWGSLLWDYDLLKLKSSKWKKSNLKLPLEFSRVSDHGHGRLSLVIDPKNGSMNNVWYNTFKTHNLNKAIKDLAKREKTLIKYISYINLKNNKYRSFDLDNLNDLNDKNNKILTNIKKFAITHNFDAIIWTGLDCNWIKLFIKPYSYEHSFEYFQQSPSSIQRDIFFYIYKASTVGNIKTPFSQYFFTNFNILIKNHINNNK